ncbi:protein Churchill [Eurytemora carolleeae]|uniref:protein Churchill n=1 Tax=Eurytemora carolleeae TaxID=1294199 RepID=UPI000C76E56D|nr:protein Churchill [Eurytemora carolleeae]|eukprot:XP_023343479.1 protein Churchill-like [Eurytemora affinis]
MCKDCVKRPFPDRGSFCLENGAYLVNLQNCSKCLKLDPGLENYGRSVGEEDEREDIEYNHICKQCNHVISQHKVRIVYFLIFILFSVSLE